LWKDIQQFKADFFKALAHPLRIRILEVLSKGDRTVNGIQKELDTEGSSVSQQLSVLRAKNIVVGTKQGKHVIYTLRDPAIIELLEAAREIFNNQYKDTINMLEKLDENRTN